jgi:hypothetical protein
VEQGERLTADASPLWIFKGSCTTAAAEPKCAGEDCLKVSLTLFGKHLSPSRTEAGDWGVSLWQEDDGLLPVEGDVRITSAEGEKGSSKAPALEMPESMK